jgi:hypothetical protein
VQYLSSFRQQGGVEPQTFAIICIIAFLAVTAASSLSLIIAPFPLFKPAVSFPFVVPSFFPRYLCTGEDELLGLVGHYICLALGLSKF